MSVEEGKGDDSGVGERLMDSRMTAVPWMGSWHMGPWEVASWKAWVILSAKAVEWRVEAWSEGLEDLLVLGLSWRLWSTISFSLPAM